MDMTFCFQPDNMALKRHRFYSPSLALASILILISASLGDSSDLTAVVGHNVTFKCPWNRSLPVERLYIQKEDKYIDGFYKGQHMTPSDNRTKVNEMELSMKMRDVRVSDEGLYKCIVFYTSTTKDISYINLKVKAEFSVPIIRNECGDGAAGTRCHLSCAAAGGYPRSDVKWEGLNKSLTSDVYKEDLEDSQNKTWSINKTLTYTCDRPTNVSCSIGGIVSQSINICKSEGVQKYSQLLVIVATVLLVVVMLIITLVLLRIRCCRSRSEIRDGDVDIPLSSTASET